MWETRRAAGILADWSRIDSEQIPRYPAQDILFFYDRSLRSHCILIYLSTMYLTLQISEGKE